MKQFKSTPSFLALLKDGKDGIAQATVRELCDAHIGRHTQDRFSKLLSFICFRRMYPSVSA
jgi:hypothetical protein